MSLLFKLKTLSEPPSATGSCSDCWVITSTLKSSAFSAISINSALLCGASPKKERKKEVSFPSNGESNRFLDMWSNTGFVLTDVKPGSNQLPSSVHPSPCLIADSRGGGVQRWGRGVGGADRRLFTESSPPLRLSVNGTLCHDWSGGIY